jgi:hypothetical protein
LSSFAGQRKSVNISSVNIMMRPVSHQEELWQHAEETHRVQAAGL